MPLTNVWCRNANGEWTRTTAREAEKYHRYSVSADSRMFRCNSCFQYVTFVKGSKQRISHFRHSAGEIDKKCEDRSVIYASNSNSTSMLASIPSPMRIFLDEKRVILEIGFLPAGVEELEKAIGANAIVSINGKLNRPDTYRIDYSRFAPHTMTWLPLPLSWSDHYSVTFKPFEAVPKFWSLKRLPLSQHGDLFECLSGRRITEKNDVMVGKEYYYLCKNGIRLPLKRSLDERQIEINNPGWKLYKICARQYTDEAADFFFDYLHLRLTAEPADIVALWPPVVEDEDMIDTNQKNLTFLLSGESDFETFPAYGNYVTSQKSINDQESVININNSGSLQMVSASRYSQKLRSFYIRRLEDIETVIQPQIQIFDDDKKLITEDVLTRMPKNGVVVIESEVDALIDVSDQYGLCYRKNIVSGKETRIIDLKLGNSLTIRQGLDIIRTISFIHPERKDVYYDVQNKWNGRMVSFPRRYAGVLSKIDRSSELFRRVLLALRSGTIPEDGLASLRRIIQEDQNER